jgi:hypothetical protein
VLLFFAAVFLAARGPGAFDHRPWRVQQAGLTRAWTEPRPSAGHSLPISASLLPAPNSPFAPFLFPLLLCCRWAWVASSWRGWQACRPTRCAWRCVRLRERRGGEAGQARNRHRLAGQPSLIQVAFAAAACILSLPWPHPPTTFQIVPSFTTPPSALLHTPLIFTRAVQTRSVLEVMGRLTKAFVAYALTEETRNALAPVGHIASRAIARGLWPEEAPDRLLLQVVSATARAADLCMPTAPDSALWVVSRARACACVCAYVRVGMPSDVAPPCTLSPLTPSAPFVDPSPSHHPAGGRH